MTVAVASARRPMSCLGLQLSSFRCNHVLVVDPSRATSFAVHVLAPVTLGARVDEHQRVERHCSLADGIH